MLQGCTLGRHAPDCRVVHAICKEFHVLVRATTQCTRHHE
jgi:hypothetical protein